MAAFRRQLDLMSQPLDLTESLTALVTRQLPRRNLLDTRACEAIRERLYVVESVAGIAAQVEIRRLCGIE